jgi:hypothetical protein
MASAVPKKAGSKPWALAPEGWYVKNQTFPRRLKPEQFNLEFGTAEAVPFQSSSTQYYL